MKLLCGRTWRWCEEQKQVRLRQWWHIQWSQDYIREWLPAASWNSVRGKCSGRARTGLLLLDNSVSYQFLTILTATATFLQCFDTVGWLTQNLRPVKNTCSCNHQRFLFGTGDIRRNQPDLEWSGKNGKLDETKRVIAIAIITAAAFMIYG